MSYRDEHPDRIFERCEADAQAELEREERRELVARHSPAPLADVRTGQVAIPVTWTALAWAILHAQTPSAAVIDAARELAQMVLDASERR